MDTTGHDDGTATGLAPDVGDTPPVAADGRDLQRIVESARRMGIEFDEVEALQWLTAVALARDSDEVVVDVRHGVFGHRVTMLDFSPEDLAHFKSIGDIVGFDDQEDVETALALSGSAAQSKVQTHPGDADFFERVNVRAPSRDRACARLAEVIRDKAMATLAGPTHRLVEVKFGTHPRDVVVAGEVRRAGSPVSWTPPQVVAGRIEGTAPADEQDGAGEAVVLTWEEVADDPGWCKLDWVVADPVRGQVAKASNMLDATWEAPDGTIESLDGRIDPYFQEVYLEADSMPLFTKTVSALSGDALDAYVAGLELEVAKYTAADHPNYGKAAKRLYNIFRLNGSYEEAAYLRELFDEPTAALYQVAAIVGTLEEASRPDNAMAARQLLATLDATVLSVVETLDGDVELEIVRDLLALRSHLSDPEVGDLEAHDRAAAAARARLAGIVNGFFRERLTAMPAIADFIDRVGATA